MPNAPSKRLNASRQAKQIVYGQAMLVTPEPEYRARKEFRKLLSLLWIPIIVSRIILMMGQNDYSALIVFAWSHYRP